MRILITTDFSSNSKAAIRFAETFKKQAGNTELILFHAIQVMKPSTWSDKHFKQYLQSEKDRVTSEMKKFAKSVFGKKTDQVTFLVENSVSSTSAIVDAAKRLKCDAIFISTRGAGILRKILGTNTEYLVNNSAVPVCAIPAQYKTKEIKNITYLSDLEQLKKELPKANALASQIKAALEIAHISMPGLDKKELKASKSIHSGSEIKVIDNKKASTLVESISGFVKKKKPDLLIMFTKRNKGFFESLFLPSKSAELTFTTKVPVLIYPK